jgi:integral membrane protein (TIGR01906 family)
MIHVDKDGPGSAPADIESSGNPTGRVCAAVSFATLRGLILGFAIIALSFSLLLTPVVVEGLASRYSDETGTGMTHVQIAQTAQDIYAFSMGADAAFPIAEQDSPTTIGQDAVTHLIQCRTLFWGGIFAAVVTAAVSVGIYAWLVRHRGPRVRGEMLLAGGVVALVVVILALVVVVTADFDVLFNWLHSLFFAKDSWFFPNDCLLIRALPLPFWEAAGVLWGVLIAIFSAISIAAGVALLFRREPATALVR